MVYKNFRLLLLAFALGIGVATGVRADNGPRQRINFDSGWKFHYGDMGSAAGIPITNWKWKVADEGGKVETLTDDAMQDAKAGDDVFHGRKGFAWFRTELPAFTDNGKPHVLHFDSVDDNATVFLNGYQIAHHEGWNDAFDVPLNHTNPGGVNLLTVYVENTAGGGGIGNASIETADDAISSGPAAPAFNDTDWRGLHLPHDFVVEGTFTPTADAGHGSLPTGVGWYRKTFNVAASEKGRSLWLDFDGVYRDSKVWLNGKLLGRHKSGYTGFRYDITDAVNYGGKNVLAVRADARAQEGWWYEGGGIYRHVWLTSTNAVHILPDSVYVAPKVEGKIETTTNITIGILPPSYAHSKYRTVDGATTVSVKIGLENGGDKDAKIKLVVDIMAADGERKARMITEMALAANAKQTVSNTFSIGDMILWSLENPYRYHLGVKIQDGNKTLDEVTVPFGVRQIRFDKDKGFFLNGKPVKIKGTCNHQDFAGVGIAMPDSLLDWRIKHLKEMGSNAYRTSHNPVAPELLDACDRLGMLVMDENRHLGDTYAPKSSTSTPYDDLSDLRDMIVRDRNHPSIIIWSMCNEENIQTTPEGTKIFAAMKKVTDELDGTRPISCAMNFGWGQGITNVEDLQGVNYAPSIYTGFHKDHPDLPMFGSETASEVGTRGEYVTDKTKGYVSAYSVNAPPWAQTSEVAWTAIGERDYVAGGFVWTGFDYKGEPTPYAWPCINSHFGIMDECGFPKDAYYYYQSWWGDKPVVHVFPHWNWAGQEGKPIDVWVHSNAAKVELFLNNVSLGAKTMKKFGHLEWQVPYAPGKLTAIGYDASGKQIAADSVETTDAPAQIKLVPDRKTMLANGEEIIMVTVSVLDKKGRVVPYAANEITFGATGAGVIAGVGNGDPSDHDPDRAAHRKAFHGLCMAVVQAKESGGGIVVTATAPGLKSATVTLSAK